MHVLLTPTGSVLKNPFVSAAMAGNLHKVDDSAVVTASEDYFAYEDAGLSTAARLQAATCPEHVAAVLQAVPASERVHRVKLWAKLSPEEIHNLHALPHLARQCLEQVCNGMIGSVHISYSRTSFVRFIHRVPVVLIGPLKLYAVEMLQSLHCRTLIRSNGYSCLSERTPERYTGMGLDQGP